MNVTLGGLKRDRIICLHHPTAFIGDHVRQTFG
jgi:hypothetical protein